MNSIDHIVYCTPTLQEGINHIHQLTSALPSLGGQHLTNGTHNAILKIGPQTYLEILAPDPNNKNVLPPLWMGINLITAPKITRWSIKSSNIKQDAIALQSYKKEYGIIETGSRALSDGAILNWKLTLPLSHPEIEVVPFLIDWQDSIHPTTDMTRQCQIIDINLNHPDPSIINKTLGSLGLDIVCSLHPNPEIRIILDTPNGKVSI